MKIIIFTDKENIQEKKNDTLLEFCYLQYWMNLTFENHLKTKAKQRKEE